MSAPLVWVTGAGGLIGSYLCAQPPSWAGRVRGLTRTQFDLADFAAVRRAFVEDHPQLVIHCAALSRSGACQENPALAHRLNVEVTAHLAELAADIPFLFFSTDLVFDGSKGGYVETDPANPLLVYAQTKVAAEKIVLANPKHLVIRTALNGGVSPAGNRGFNEEMRLAWQAGRTLNLFVDEFRSPIPAAVTAHAVWELAAQNQPGLYHLGGAERLSRVQIGQLLAARWPELEARIQPGSLRDFSGPPRPPDVSMNCAKIQRLLSFRLPGLGEWLAANPHEPF